MSKKKTGKLRKNTHEKKSTFRPPAFEAGNPGEEIIERIAQELRCEKFIERYLRAKKCGFLDSKGIDFVFCRKGKIIVLQITMAREKVQSHLKRHPKIPVMVVERGCNAEDKKQELKNFIEQFTPAVEKILDKRIVRHICELLEYEGGSW